jgi:hypothetical protein
MPKVKLYSTNTCAYCRAESKLPELNPPAFSAPNTDKTIPPVTAPIMPMTIFANKPPRPPIISEATHPASAPSIIQIKRVIASPFA